VIVDGSRHGLHGLHVLTVWRGQRSNDCTVISRLQVTSYSSSRLATHGPRLTRGSVEREGPPLLGLTPRAPVELWSPAEWCWARMGRNGQEWARWVKCICGGRTQANRAAL
jgi:hypothetical protein